MTLKEKWLYFVTEFNKKRARGQVVYLGPKPWKHAKPFVYLHPTRLLGIAWAKKRAGRGYYWLQVDEYDLPTGYACSAYYGENDRPMDGTWILVKRVYE